MLSRPFSIAFRAPNKKHPPLSHAHRVPSMTNKCRSSRQRGQTRRIQADAGARAFRLSAAHTKTKKTRRGKKTFEILVSPLAPPTAAPSEEGRTSPSEERQQSRLLSEPRRMHRHRACVVFERRKGREEGDGTLSRRNRNGVAVDNTGGRRPHLGGRIQTPKRALISPTLAPARIPRPFLRTRAGWAPSRRRCPVSRWTSRFSSLFLRCCRRCPSAGEKKRTPCRLSLSRAEVSHARERLLLWLLLLDDDWKMRSEKRIMP